MSDNKDYVMLPSRGRKKGPHWVILFSGVAALLVIVGVVSFNLGRKSGQEVPVSPTPVSYPPVTSTEAPPTEEEPGMEPESPPVPEVGGIAITTEPAGAMIRISHMDEEVTREGSDPMTIPDLPAGFYQIQAQMEGYRTAEATFEVLPGRLREMDPMMLERTTGILEIHTSAPANFRLTPNGQSDQQVAFGVAPAESRELPTGTYRLTLSREGWPDVEKKITIAEGMTTETSFEYAEGGLKLTSKPSGARVLMAPAGSETLEERGTTPMELKELPAGDWKVSLQLADHPTRELTIPIEAGEVATQEITWSRSPVTITSEPPGALVFLNGDRLEGAGNPVTPFQTTLLDGEHQLLAVQDGLDRQELTATVAPGKDNVIHFRFEAGSVQIDSEPTGADVFLGDKLKGRTPLKVTGLKPGEYVFQLRRERYDSMELSARISKGNTASIKANLIYDPTPEPEKSFTNGSGQLMVWIPELKIWAGNTETTQANYEAIKGENPSFFKEPDLPVHNITWNAASRFCELLTIEETGLGFVPKGYKYRLPSDAEWSFLARGSDLDASVTSINVRRGNPAAVGTSPANAHGMHDMLGNVWEWCEDYYTRDVYEREQIENASGQLDRIGLRFRVLRGGSWSRDSANSFALGNRLLADPAEHSNYETGMRVVLVPDN